MSLQKLLGLPGHIQVFVKLPIKKLPNNQSSIFPLGQWGPINFNVGLFLGMIAGTLSSVVESIGDYHACARACGQRQPPSHSVNRGIAVEGLCCIFGGLIGSGVSVTTYSENIGVIGITKVL